MYKAVTYSEAIQLFEKNINFNLKIETKKPIDAIGQILAEDVFLNQDVPAQPIAAFDGFAARSLDTPGILKIVGRADNVKAIAEKETVLINTGEYLPIGADTVIPIESVTIIDDIHIKVPKSNKGWNVDVPGSFGKSGELLAKKCSVINNTLGIILSSINIEVKVFEKIKVKIITSFRKVESTSYLLDKLLRRYVTWVEPDLVSLNELNYENLSSALRDSHAGIAVGSVGPSSSDALQRMLLQSKDLEVVFRGVEIKGGRPSSFLIFDNKPLLWISGPPATISTTFFLLVLPFLKRMSGCNDIESMNCIKAKLAIDYPFVKPVGLYVKLMVKDNDVYACPVSPEKQHILDYLLLVKSHGVVPLVNKVIKGGMVDVYLLP